MITFYKKYARTIFDISLIVLTVYLTMSIFNLLYSIAKPIFIGLVIFMIIEPMASFFHKRGMKKSIATTIATLIFIIVILGALTTIGIILTSETIQLAKALPGYATYLQDQILLQSDYLQDKLNAIPDGVIDKLKEYAEKTPQYIENWLLALWGTLTSVTSFLINFVIGLILAYFLSLEYEMWNRIAKEKTPSTFKEAYSFLKENVIKGIASYLKAQIKLVSITFFIILVALLLLGVSNAFTIALLAAVFDLLPVLGVSTVFIPWIVYLLIIGDMTLALWLLVVFGTVIIIRQILEPKITGESLGVSAFTMLSFMIISLSLFGIAGVILSPILLILIKALYDQGYLSRWIRKPEGEYSLDRDVLIDETNIESEKQSEV